MKVEDEGRILRFHFERADRAAAKPATLREFINILGNDGRSVYVKREV